MRDYLVQNCKERVLKRINLLRAFYTDLSALNNDDFLKKHRKHCSKGFLKKMKKLSEEKNNYDWTLFYSRETCSPKDIKYNYANKDPFSTSKKKELYVLFPFYNTENRWIEVMMDNQSIWVKVDGEGKHVAITGIVNADKKIEIETALDR